MKLDSIKDTRGISLDLVVPECLYLADKFLCHLCRFLVKDPHCCGKCQECFCKECFNNYKKNRKNAKCPNFDHDLNRTCNNKLDEGYDITNREKALLNLIWIKCWNHQAGCELELSYEDFYKHVKNCKYRIFRCLNQGCDFQASKEKVSEHKLTCMFSKFTCEFCKQEYPSSEFKEHQEFCDECEKYCVFCKKTLKVKNMYNHNPYCKRELLNFFSDENMKKIKDFDEILQQYKELDRQLKSYQTTQKECVMLARKKKPIIEDEEEFDRSLKESGGKIAESQIDKNPYFEDKPNVFKNDINWMNGSKIMKMIKSVRTTFYSPLNLKKDFLISVSVNFLNEKNSNFMLGFSGETIHKQNYFPGNSSSYLEWSLNKDGQIIEHNRPTKEFKGVIKIESGTVIDLHCKDKYISFKINEKNFDYGYKFDSDNMFLMCSLMFQDEEVEIVNFVYN